MILGIDTTSPLISVAIVRSTSVLARRTLPQRSASELLLGSLRDCLASADSRLNDLDGIVCLGGPGSFTGIRIGLATVLALHEATGIPCAAVSVLETLALLPSSPPAESDATRLCAVDALRGSLFVQSFDREPGSGAPRGIEGARRLSDAEALALLRSRSISSLALSATAERSVELRDLVEREGIEATIRCAGIDAPYLAELAIQRAQLPDFDWQVETLSQPIYLQNPAVSSHGRNPARNPR